MSLPKPMKFARFKNVSKHHVTVPDLGIDAAPGEECMLPEGYAFPRRSHAGGRFPSIIEQLANCPGCDEMTRGKNPDGSPNHVEHCMLAPVDADDAARFARTPEHEEAPKAKAKMPTVAELVAAGVPRGHAEVLVKAALAAAQGAKEEKAEKPADEKPAAKVK